MTKFHHIYRAAFTPEECAEFNAHAMTKAPQAGTVVNYGKQGTDDKQRSAVCRWLRAYDGTVLLWAVRMQGLMQQANAEYFGVDCQPFTTFQHTEYAAASAGHHDWHEDCNWGVNASGPYDRKLTGVVLMTDPGQFSGGELMLDRCRGAKLELRQGDLIVFPAFVKHRVSPVTSGVRHSLVAWCYGPNWR